MKPNKFDILAISPQTKLQRLFDHLEQNSSYHIHYVPNLESAKAYSAENTPCAIFLVISRAEHNDPEALRWLEGMRDRIPVLVLSTLEDLRLYTTAMDHGAFDFITAYTTRDEVDRIVASALQGCECNAA